MPTSFTHRRQEKEVQFELKDGVGSHVLSASAGQVVEIGDSILLIARSLGPPALPSKALTRLLRQLAGVSVARISLRIPDRAHSFGAQRVSVIPILVRRAAARKL